jgi:hypothetical protein
MSNGSMLVDVIESFDEVHYYVKREGEKGMIPYSSLALCEADVAYYAKQGIKCEIITRTEKVGYKVGQRLI